jgi:3-oxoacyl-(acyl-carrier-protein) synthase
VKYSDGIFITGIGIVSPLGRGRHTTLESINNSICGIRPLTLFNAAEDQRMPAGEIAGTTCLASDVPPHHASCLSLPMILVSLSFKAMMIFLSLM